MSVDTKQPDEIDQKVPRDSNLSKIIKRLEKGLDDEEKEILETFRNSHSQNCMQWWKLIWSNVTVEPILLLLDIATQVSGAVPMFLLIEKVCHVQMEIPSSNCSSILYGQSNNTHLEEIHKKMAEWSMIISIMTGIFSILMTLMVTSWSDKHGRKFPMIAPIFFQMTWHISLILNALFFDAPIYIYVLSRIPSAIFGTFLVFPIILAYLADVSTEKNRAIRFMILNIVADFASIVSSFIGGQVFKFGGFIAVFGTSIGFYVIAAIYGIFFIKETDYYKEKQTEAQITFKEKLADFFSLDTLTGSLKSVFKARPNNGRCQLLMWLIASQFMEQTYSGTNEVSLLFQQYIFKWNATDTANYSGILAIIRGTVSIASIVLLALFLRGKDSFCGIIGTLSTIIGFLVLGYSREEWIYYFGRFVESWNIFSGPAFIAILAFIVPENELGKLIGVNESFIRIFELGSVPGYQGIYRLTIEFFPGAVYFISAALIGVPLCYFVYLAFSNTLNNLRTQRKVESIDGKSEEENENYLSDIVDEKTEMATSSDRKHF